MNHTYLKSIVVKIWSYIYTQNYQGRKSRVNVHPGKNGEAAPMGKLSNVATGSKM